MNPEDEYNNLNNQIDSFLEDGANEQGEFILWLRKLSWKDKNIVGAILLERFLEEGEDNLSLFEDMASKVIRRYQLQ